MKSIVIFILLISILFGCTSEIKRTAADDAFTSPSSPSLQIEFQEFSFKGINTELTGYDLGTKSQETYTWEDENNSRKVVITIQTHKHNYSRRKGTEAGKEWWTLCSGTSEINNDHYETIIDMLPAPTIANPNPTATHIYKKYTLFIGNRSYIVLGYQEKLSPELAQELAAWKTEKRDALKRGTPAVADKLKKKRQETPFKAIIAFEQRADEIMKATNTEHFVPKGAYY